MAVPVGSIINRGLKTLGDSFRDSVNFVDLAYASPETDLAVLEVVAGQALINALELWLQSQTGDYYRRPLFGGIVDTLVRNYPLSPEGAIGFGSALTAAIEAQFTSITIVLLTVDPDVKARGWAIKLVVKDNLTGFTGGLTTGLAVPN